MVTDRVLPPAVRVLERSRIGRAALRTYRRMVNPYDPHRPRVLCVGFQKTGTTSFGRAMRQLGFSHFGYDRDLAASLESGDVGRCLAWAANFNSLDDLPWSSPDFVAEYRTAYPASRYVLLERDERDWLRSYFAHYRPSCTEDEALDRLRSHQRQMLELLAHEPHVLRMSICAGEGYERLCPFLGVPVPALPFPWENRRSRGTAT